MQFVKNNISIQKRMTGFTLLESLISLSIFAAFASIAISSYHDMILNQRLESAATQIYNDLSVAKSEAIKQNKKIHVSFSQQNHGWCYGINEEKQCDCNKANDCRLNAIETVFKGDEFKGIMLQKARFAGGGSSTVFDPRKGFAIGKGVKNGSIWLKAENDSQMAVIINRLGRIRFCSKDLDRYSKQCPKLP